MLTAFRDILQKTARSLGIEPAMHLVQAREVWPEILGPALAGASEPRALRGGVLMVTATHALAAGHPAGHPKEGGLLRCKALVVTTRGVYASSISSQSLARRLGGFFPANG